VVRTVSPSVRRRLKAHPVDPAGYPFGVTSSDYAAVFFDAGETLVHPHPTFPDLFAETLRTQGYDVSAETVRERGHVVFERFRAAARANELWTTSLERSRAFWHDVYGVFIRELGIQDADGLLDVLYATFTDLANYRVFEDVPPVLDRLRDAGMVLGVVSNFEEWLEQLLERLGVRSYFSVSVVSGIEGMEKPDPRIFALAMERAGVRPDASVYVGDNPEFDVGPALAAGMFPVLIDRRERFRDAPGARITSMVELPDVLGIA
jgi:putative hydrolase of the HAD superfamily